MAAPGEFSMGQGPCQGGNGVWAWRLTPMASTIAEDNAGRHRHAGHLGPWPPGLRLDDHLDRNDAYGFFQRFG